MAQSTFFMSAALRWLLKGFEQFLKCCSFIGQQI
jgi:hypothetical protein